MTTDLKQQIGRALKAKRLDRGLTQERLAEAIGRTVEAISSIERGRIAPSLDTLERISRALDVPIRDFFVGLAGGGASQDRRRSVETRLGAALRLLSDRDAEIALRQVEVFAKVGR